MALGKKKIRQEELFVASAELRKGPGHPFYTKLNEVFAEAEFDGESVRAQKAKTRHSA